MQGKDTTKSTFSQLFQPLFAQRSLIQDMGVDKYVKKLFTLKLIPLLVESQLKQHKGLREVRNSLNNEDFSTALDLKSISPSQISRRLRNLPVTFLADLFNRIGQDVHKSLVIAKSGLEINSLRLIDSSTISLCLPQHLWAKFRKTKAGIKLHLCFESYEDTGFPSNALVTSAKPADRTQMDSLITEPGAVYVFDRGYLDYGKFDEYCKEGISFVTRIKSNTVFQVVQELSINPEDEVKTDRVVCLGAGAKKMHHQLRLVELVDTQGNPVAVVTNNFELPAKTIGDIYRRRWQIELFFKWIKQHLNVKKFHGQSEAAITNQVYIALITYCLLVLLEARTGHGRALLDLTRLLAVCMFEPFTIFVQKLHISPSRKTKGRRKTDYGEQFKSIERMVMAGRSAELDARLPNWAI